ncbi:putative ATPase [Kineococcus xinjiangensis]|uniref:Putative ATPase n=1 Tax=Kineococcus xinjiangensis TaxID=512762 RepID=A0A2S6INV5_9ACTN|nr:AAA family ATPase [Kineococcus xinjiangensis]PPK95933.1 putative ATPase [Kineococcus xinjiangensis]
MLTRLEVRGFKNLLDVDVDFGPFTCIAGENGIGKSNVFDVIEFLSFLASETLAEAAQRVRAASGTRSGDPRDLFWDGYRNHHRVIHLAAEMLVPRHVEDDLGAEAEASTTFLRYELSLGYEPPAGEGSVGRIALLREHLSHITKGQAALHLKFPHVAKSFRSAVVTGERRGGPFISTEERESGTVINVHGDGGSFGRPQPRGAARAGRTVLSSVTTNDYPTILAARREMQSWRRLALEPSALRAPDGFDAPRSMAPDGRHLAATLHRIAHQVGSDGSQRPEAVFARVAGRLSDLAGVSVDGVTVDLDPVREVFTLFLNENKSMRLPARALSEGTLRFLALCVLLEDAQATGLICMEEPENGIHPVNLPAMLELVRDLAVDPRLAPDEDNPFRQVIVNTHSPGVVQLCEPADLLRAETVLVPLDDGGAARALALRPYKGSWRLRGESEADSAVKSFTEADVIPYLVAPPGAQLTLPVDV